MGSAGTVFNLNIGGNVIVGEDENTPGGSLHLGNVTSYEDTKWGGPMDVVTVGGDIILYNTSKLFMNSAAPLPSVSAWKNSPYILLR